MALLPVWLSLAALALALAQQPRLVRDLDTLARDYVSFYKENTETRDSLYRDLASLRDDLVSAKRKIANGYPATPDEMVSARKAIGVLQAMLAEDRLLHTRTRDIASRIKAYLESPNDNVHMTADMETATVAASRADDVLRMRRDSYAGLADMANVMQCTNGECAAPPIGANPAKAAASPPVPKAATPVQFDIDAIDVFDS